MGGGVIGKSIPDYTIPGPKTSSVPNDKLQSTWIVGAEEAETIKDNFGKSYDQIYSHIKDANIKNIVELWEKQKHFSSDTFNSFTSVLKKIGLDVAVPMEALKSILDNGKRIVDAVRQGLDIAKLIKDGSYEAAAQMMSGVLGDGIGKVLKEGVNIYKDGKRVYDFGKDAYIMVKNSDFHSIDGINKFIYNLTGTNVLKETGLLDLQAKAVGVLEAAQKLGFHHGIDKIFEKMELLHPGLQQKLGEGMMLNARHGQIDTMESILKIIDGRTVFKTNEAIIPTMIKNYRFPLGYDSKDRELVKQQFIRVIEKLNPNAFKTTLDGEIYYLTQPWREVSSDAKALFGNDPEYGDIITFARDYRPEYDIRVLNQMYPSLKL